MEEASRRKKALPVVLEHEDVSLYGDRGELSHWHDAIELVCVTHGRMECQTNGDVLVLGKGDVCFVNQRQLHFLRRSGGSEGRGITLAVDAQALLRDADLYDAYVRPVQEDPSFAHLLVHAGHERAARVREEVREVDLLLRERPVAFELEVMARCCRILRELYCALAERGERTGAVDGNLAPLRAMIGHVRRHFGENLQLGDIAQAGNVSKSTCTRLFKRYTGRSPVSYLIDYRLEAGAALLRETDDPVSSVAQACGFSQQSYFNRMFLRAYGTTPLAYRKAGGAPAQDAR